MKYIKMIVAVSIMALVVGCSNGVVENGVNEPKQTTESTELTESDQIQEEVVEEPTLSEEEMKRVALYIEVLTQTFNIENGGDDFIALDLKSLTDISDEGRALVVEGLSELTKEVLDFESIKEDTSRFKFEDDMRMCTINGSVLSIRIDEYSEDSALIEGECWFGVLGAVFPKYKATYKDGKWELELESLAMS